jgi:endonuclease YncB( thermonuclease family)
MLKFAAVVWLLVHAIGVNAAQFTGRVVAVLDGDTIVVLATDRQRVRVRLAGIDAPEKGQPFANRAKAHLSHLVHARDVVVDWHKRDPYGRVVGKVRVSGVDAALEMVTSGLAWHYARFANEQSPADRKLYAQAQARAREERRGLWRDRDPGLRGRFATRMVEASSDARSKGPLRRRLAAPRRRVPRSFARYVRSVSRRPRR